MSFFNKTDSISKKTQNIWNCPSSDRMKNRPFTEEIVLFINKIERNEVFIFLGHALNQANKATISKFSKIEMKQKFSQIDMVWTKEEYKRLQRKQFIN